jgi:class 3 adenylate cyclase/CheY-like chemotaxis protein
VASSPIPDPQRSNVDAPPVPAGRARILVADDVPDNIDLVIESLDGLPYEIVTAVDGQEAVQKFKTQNPDLALLDVMMPKLSGIEVCRYIKATAARRFVPVCLLTAKTASEAKVEGLDAGADDYLTKPFDPFELQARVRAMLRIKSLQDDVQKAKAELEEINRDLERRVENQVREIDRVNRLRRYLAPGLVDSVLASDQFEVNTAVRRRELTIFFSDIRNFTQMADQLEPEEVKAILDDYLSDMTEVIFRHQGTINKFMGDGIMVFFGDPIPQPDHQLRALTCAVEMRDRALALQARLHSRLPAPFWIGMGIHTGTATVGNLGTGQQLDYTAIGSAVNLAARLQGLSLNNEVIASATAYEPVRDRLVIRNERKETIRGFAHPITVAEIVAVR